MIGSDDKRQIGWLPIGVLTLNIVMLEIPYLLKLLGGYSVQLPFILLYFILEFKSRITISRSNVAFVICTFLYFLIAIVYRVVGISSAAYGNYIQPVAFFFFYYALISSVERMDLHQKKFVFAATVISMLFTITQNWIMYNRFGAYYYEQLRSTERIVTNAVNTQYATSVMLMSGTMLICFFRAKRHRILWLSLFFVLFLFNLLVTQRSIALLLSILLYALITVFHYRNSLFRNILIILGGIVLIVVIINYAVVIDYLIRHISSDRIVQRLYQIRNAMDAQDIQEAGGSLTARYNLIMVSIRSWLSSVSSFFFGIGDHRINNLRIGNHSNFFDSLGQYGIFGALILFYSVFKTLKNTVAGLHLQRRSTLYRQVLSLMLIVVARSLIGAILVGSISIQLFIVLPISLSMVQEYEEERFAQKEAFTS